MELFKKHTSWFVAALLIAFVAFSVKLAWDDSTTMDEKAHIPASYSYVKYLDMRINPEHPPLIKDLSGLALLALPELAFPVPSILWERGDENVDQSKHPEGPVRNWGLAQWEFGDRFLFGMGNDPDLITFMARLPIILIALLLGYMIFRWTRELGGTLAGLFALLLFVADPNILAHNHLVTTDIGIAAFIFFSAYFFVRFLKDPSWKNVFLSGLFLGLANLAKFSAVILFPLFGLLVILYAFAKSRPDSVPEEISKQWRFRTLLSYVGKFAASVGICFIAIWALYVPNVWNMPAEVTQEIARAVFPNDRVMGRFAESTIVGMGEIPILKPLAHYFLGVFMVFARVAGGNTYFFLGEVSNQASTLYFPLVFLMKSTLPFLAILSFAFFYGAWRIVTVARRDREAKKSWGSVFAHSFETHIAEYTMLSFVALYVYLSITGNLNIGFRHLFPILPFLIVLGTKTVFVYWNRHRGNHTTWTTVRVFLFSFTLWIALIPVFAFPSSYLSYFNSAMGGPSEGYRYVTDSNYDWGQDAKRLKLWVEKYNLCVSNNQESSAECRMLTADKFFPTDTPIQKIRVDYFGGASPEYYLKDKYLSWHSHNTPEPGWYAVSAGFYQESIHKKDQPEGNINYSWFPTGSWIGRAGDSIFIFYVENVPEKYNIGEKKKIQTETQPIHQSESEKIPEKTKKNNLSIFLLYPVGGEILKKGSTYTIKWAVSNENGERTPDTVYLSLFGQYQEKGCETSEGSSVVACPQDIYSIAENVPNNGEFTWTVEENIKPGKYSLEIFSKLDKINGLGDRSNFFEVTN